MENTVKKIINQATKWVGYLEKRNNAQLDDFTANAGSNNYTCFARDYKAHTGGNYQAQPWCAIYVSEMFVQAFGLENAKKMLGGNLYHYCPNGVNQFKAIGRWSRTPEPGAIIFFTNGTRAYHTGIVVEVTANRVKTVEGNTSGISGVVENGGGVFRKSYSKTDQKILGYGIPDWKVVQTYIEGFKRAADGVRWWYQNADGSYPADQWMLINHHWYLFDHAGYMCTGWHRWDGNVCDPAVGGDWYFLDNTVNGPLEGACWHTKANGAQEIWYVE